MIENYYAILRDKIFRENQEFYNEDVSSVLTNCKGKLMLWIALLFLSVLPAVGQTGLPYDFSQATGAYTPITGGIQYLSSTTTFIDDDVYTNLPIGFTFKYKGTDYTNFGINANGWISMGSTAPVSSAVPLSSGTTNNVISAFGVDLIARQHFLANRTTGSAVLTITSGNTNNITLGSSLVGTGVPTGATVTAKTASTITMSATATTTGTGAHVRVVSNETGIRYQTIGTAPNRSLVVQFTEFSQFTNTGVTAEKMNFQIVLNETSNTINMIYNFVVPASTASILGQVGLRGASSSDSVYRTSTTSWTSTTSSTTSSTISYTGSVYPPSGLTYTWTPSTAPTISATTLTGFGNICINTPSAANSFTLTGSNLTTADIIVGALANFTYSTTQSGTYTNTLTLTSSNGSLNQVVWVKFTPPAVQAYTGNIPVTGGGTTGTVNVAASGTGVNTAPAFSSNGTAGTITNTAATITGTTISNIGCSAVTAYGIQYSTSSSFPAGSTTSSAVGTGFSGANNGTYTTSLTGLTAGTLYYYRGYATNSGGTTNYATTSSFTTQYATIVPWSEPFATASTVPAGWSTTGWTISSTTNLGTGTYIYKNLYSTIPTGNFTTINVGLLGNNDRLAFEYRHANFSGTGAPAAGSGSFTVEISSNFGSTWTTVATVNNNAVEGWQLRTLPLSAYSGQYVKIRITGTTTTGDYYLGFDNFKIEPTPSCELPVAPFASSAVTVNSATITWGASSSAPASGYEYWYTTTSNNPNTTNPGPSGVTVAGVTTANLTGLTAATTYNWWVRAACSSTAKSTWASGGSFTTAKLEPTNHVTAFAVTTASVTTAAIPLTWTAATGAVTPDGYNLKANNTATIAAPVDGTDPGTGSLSLATLPASYKTASASATFTGGTAGTMYYFANYPYTNSSTNINFKTDGTVPTLFYATKPAAATAVTGVTSASGIQNATISWTLPTTFVPANHRILVFVKDNSTIATAGTLNANPANYTANTVLGSGTPYQLDANAFNVYNGTGTSVIISGLSANRTYYIAVVTVMVNPNSDNTYSYSAIATSNFTTQYCVASSSGTTYEINSVVTTNGTTNISNTGTTLSANGYGDYTNLSASAIQEGAVNFTITAGTAAYASIWIDYNNDLTFSTAERVYNSTTTATSITGSFTVPATAIAGNHRMRIRTSSSSSPSACGALTTGETEDYTFTVLQAPMPTITSFTPDTYCAASGVITINGTNFNNAVVKIGNTTIASGSVTINAAKTQITATVQAGVSGLVSVTTAGGTATSTTSFSVTAPPVITLSSTSDAICPGTSTALVTITSGLASYTTFTVTSVPAGAPFGGTAQTGYTFSPTINTVYTISGSNSSSGCATSATFSVTLNIAPGAVTVTPVTAEICNGNIQQLSAAGGTIQNLPILTEGFNAATNNWVTTNNSIYNAAAAAWTLRPNGYVYINTFNSNDASQFYLSNSDAQYYDEFSGTQITDTYLTSPSFSLSGYTEASLKFYHYFRYSNPSEGVVEISTNGGSTWTDLQVYTSTQGTSTSFALATIDLTPYINNANVKIRFNFYADYGYYWAIDNVSITGTVVSPITWTSNTPANTLYTDAAATIPYTGTAATTVYVKPAATTTYTATATNAQGCVKIATSTITVLPKQWIGGTSTDYNNPANWCGNQIPTLNDDITIGAMSNQPVISGGITVVGKSLNVQDGATLTVQGGNTLQIANAVTVAPTGNVMLQNNAVLLQSGTVNSNTGNIEAHRNGSVLYRLDYTQWSSPVAGQNLKAFSPNTVTSRFYKYDTENNVYVSSSHIAFDPLTENFAPGAGYLIRMPHTGTADYNAGTESLVFDGTFKGVPNNGTIPVTLAMTGNRYNMLGNPYPSPISVTQFFAANPNLEGTMYIWRKRNGEDVSSAYITLTADGDFAGNGQAGADNPQGILQTGQGFITRALNSQVSNTVNFTNTMRVNSHLDSAFFRDGNNVEKHRVWLNLANSNGVVGQTLVGYKSNATNGIDNGADAAFMNDADASFNSLIEDKAYAIQGRALPFNSDDEVPMQFKTINAGDYTVSIDHFDGLFETQQQNIFIKDNITGTLHNLRNAAYNFVTEAGEFNNRFTIVYTDAPAMGTETPEFTANNVIIYKQQKAIHINTGTTGMQDVKVYDIAGRLVYNAGNLDTSKHVIDNLQVAEQVLVIQITTVNGAIVSKKVIY